MLQKSPRNLILCSTIPTRADRVAPENRIPQLAAARFSLGLLILGIHMSSMPEPPVVDISDLQGIFLDRAIARCDDYCENVEWFFFGDHFIGHVRDYDGGYCGNLIICDTKNAALTAKLLVRYGQKSDSLYSPSTQWQHAGRLIQYADLLLTKCRSRYVAHSPIFGAFEIGETQTEAIARAYLRHCAVLNEKKEGFHV